MNYHQASSELTYDEIRAAIQLARRVKAMKGKAVHHACGDLYCYDPKCLTLVDIHDRYSSNKIETTNQGNNK